MPRKAAASEAAHSEPVEGPPAPPTTEQVPLSRLKLHPANTRKAGSRAEIEALAASIDGHGLLSNLIGTRSAGDDFIWIIAGGRRLAALQHLARSGRLPKDHPVPVLIRANDELTREASLAENVQRQQLSPAAEARAFARLVEVDEIDAAGIAVRFGLTTRHVAQRLRLAGLAPAVLDALDDGTITLDMAQAFTSVPDQRAQVKVLKSLNSWDRSPDGIRRRLRDETDGERGSSVECHIVGRDTFLRAGGEIIEDLFSDAGDAVWRPGSLLDSLFGQRRAEAAADLARQHGFGGLVDDWLRGEGVESVSLEQALALPAEERAGVWFQLRTVLDPETGVAGFAFRNLWRLDVAPTPAAPAPAEPETAEPADAGEPVTAAFKMPAIVDAMLAMRRRDALAWGLASASDYGPAVKLATFLLIERGPDGTRDWTAAGATSLSAHGLEDPITPGKEGHAWAGDELDAALADALAGGDAPLPVEWRQLQTAEARFAAFCELDFADVLRWQAVAIARTLKSGSALSRTPPLHDVIAGQLAAAGVTVDVAELWRPDADFFKRIGKAGCLAFLADVGLDASGWAKWKLSELTPACAALANGDSSKLGGLGGAMPGAIESTGRIWLPAGMAFEGTA